MSSQGEGDASQARESHDNVNREEAFDYPIQCNVPKLRLQDPVNISDLTSGVGTQFEVLPNEPYQDYDDDDVPAGVPKNPIDLSMLDIEALGDLGSDSESEGEDGPTPFQRIARKMEQVTADGGIMKEVLMQGTGGVVKEKSFVTVHYNAYLEHNDEPFDSSRLRGKTMKLMMGEGTMFPGFEIALSTMRKSEESRFIFKPEYFLGERGCGYRVPAGQTTLWRIELIDWADTAGVHEYYSMPMSERRQCEFSVVKKVIEKDRQEGKDFFKQKSYKRSARAFEKAIKVLEEHHLKDDAEEAEQQGLLLKMYQNASLCHLNLRNYSPALRHANDALSIDPKSPKARFFKGKALRLNGDFTHARTQLLKAQQLEPKNKAVREELILLEQYAKKFEANEKDLYRRMFSYEANGNKENKENKKVELKKDQLSEAPCSDGFRETVQEQFETFRDDAEMNEMPLPYGVFSKAELDCISDTAHKLDLRVIKQGRDSNLHIRISKSFTEGAKSSP